MEWEEAHVKSILQNSCYSLSKTISSSSCSIFVNKITNIPETALKLWHYSYHQSPLYSSYYRLPNTMDSTHAGCQAFDCFAPFPLHCEVKLLLSPFGRFLGAFSSSQAQSQLVPIESSYKYCSSALRGSWQNKGTLLAWHLKPNTPGSFLHAQLFQTCYSGTSFLQPAPASDL